MKQTILAALLLASTTSLFAQKETEKIEFRPHWYMQVQGGIGHTIGEGKFSDLVSPAAALSAGYRFTPVWGLRGGFSGWQGKGCWVNPRQEYKFNYAQLNAEATFDIANCLGGFNHKRFFNPYLFAGIGVNMAFNNDDAVALNEAGNKLQYLWDDTKAFVAGRLGVGMDFRICDAVAFNLEGNANTLSDHFNSKKAGNADWQFNILAGVSIRFGKGYTRKTQKAAPTSIPPRNVPKEEPKEDPKPVVVPEKKTEKLQPIQVNVFFKINSAVIRPEEAGTLLPVYPLTQGLSNKMVSRQVAEALHQVEQLPDPLAGSGLPRQYGLMSYSEALHAVHSPRDWAAIETGRSRMVFDELLCLTICFARMRQGRALRHIVPMQPHPLTAYYQALPYQLTGAQQRAIAEAIGDMCSGTPMNRLVQGDVGSGKTAVAMLAEDWTIQNGYQAAMMAPTEVLARQHAASFHELLEPAGITVVLLTGSLTAKEKRERLAQVADGTAQMVIGTHAVIQKGVEFQKLGLAITDEQHRFGVRQRSTLAEKGENVHTLVMTATPIPRTLALILYGDLDISIIDELPPGRQKIDTLAVDSRYHPRIYAFIEKHVAAGRQAYVICPMIAENEKLEVQSVLEYTAELTEELPHCRVACVHGKMKAKESRQSWTALRQERLMFLYPQQSLRSASMCRMQPLC